MQNDNLEQLTRKQLYQIYLDEEVGDVQTLKQLAQDNHLKFNTETLVATSSAKRQDTRDTHLQWFKDDIIKAIREHRGNNGIPKPKIPADEAKANLKRYDQSEEYKANQLKLAEQRKKIEEQRAEIEANRKIIEDLRKEIATHIAKQPANSDIHEAYAHVPAPPEQLNKPSPYGASEDFKKSHHNMTFNEYRKLGQQSDEKVIEMIKYLESDQDTWRIDFQQFNSISLKQL